MAVATSSLTVDEFMQLYNDEGPFEWVDGERIPMAPQVTRSSRIAGRLFRRLADHVDANQLGEVFIETPFITTSPDNPDWVTGSRTPDVMFVSADRLSKLASNDPNWDEKPLLLVPDLAVEVISPTDRFTAVSKKIADYLRDGVQLVWVINPRQSTITVHVQGSNQQTLLDVDQTLTGGDLISGFEIAISALMK